MFGIRWLTDSNGGWASIASRTEVVRDSLFIKFSEVLAWVVTDIEARLSSIVAVAINDFFIFVTPFVVFTTTIFLSVSC